MARRVDSLDVARGTAMLFVCLSHFAASYLSAAINPSVSPALQRSGEIAGTISMIASPTFIAVSGIVVAYLYRCSPDGMPALRRKLIDRGLFLLLVGHLLLAIPAYLRFDTIDAFTFELITDAIAVLIIVGPSVVMWTSSKARLALGLAILVWSWVMSYLLVPRASLGRYIVGYTFGVANDTTAWGFSFAPWLGVYLLATVLGEGLGARTRSRSTQNLMLHVGLASASAGATITIVRHLIRALAPTVEAQHSVLFGFLSISRKYPPGPTYLLLFGGTGLILISQAFALARNGAWPAFTRPVAAIGRASFFIFIFQGFLYVLILPALGLPYPALWPVYYVVSLVIFLAAATIWNAFEGNRYLTVGLWRAQRRGGESRAPRDVRMPQREVPG